MKWAKMESITTYNTYTMPDGLRVIHQPSTSPVVYCGYVVNAGTRDEKIGEEGLAHFCEHLTFKGTRTRKAWNILTGIESVGGELNAFTTKEDTVFYVSVMKDDVRRAIDLLSDIVFHSTYPQSEINKEVNVICEEIESYNDSPAELIYDEFENLLFHGHPLGHNILGKPEKLRTYTTADALNFTQKYYRADNAVFFLSGDVEFSQLKAMLSRFGHDTPDDETKHLPIAHKRRCSPIKPPRVATETVEINSHQAHVMMGNRAYDYTDRRRTTLYLLNNLLAGPALSSRINLALRERNAIVYTVESCIAAYSDTGAWTLYFGCEPQNVEKCCRYVRKELDRVMQKPLLKTQLDAAKRQLRGQIGIACDNRESFAIDFAKHFLHHGEGKDIQEILERIDATTPEMMQQVAQDIFAPEHITTLIMK